jgi:hypothetical protein
MADDLEAKVLTLLHDQLDSIADDADDPHKGRLTICVELLDAVLPADANGQKAAGGDGP